MIYTVTFNPAIDYVVRNLGLSQFFSTFVTRLIIFLILQINKISNH